METYLAVTLVIIVIAGLVWWLVRFGGPEATRKALYSKNQRLEAEGLPHEERLFRLLSTRRSWENLPPAFSRELSERLNTVENIADFIYLSERHRLEAKEFQRISNQMDDADIAMRVTATALTRHYLDSDSRKSKREVETALRLATIIAPDDWLATLKLAIVHYGIGCYEEAAPLFERGLSVAEEANQKFEGLEAVLASYNLALPHESFGNQYDLDELIGAAKEMYESCKSKIA